MPATLPQPAFELADVGRLVRRGERAVVGAARAEQPETVASVLRQHLNDPTDDLAVIEEIWPTYDHVNVVAGIDAWLEDPSRSAELVGMVGGEYRRAGLAELLGATLDGWRDGPFPGSVARVNLSSGPDGQVRPCVRRGLYLIKENARRTAVLVYGVRTRNPDRRWSASRWSALPPTWPNRRCTTSDGWRTNATYSGVRCCLRGRHLRAPRCGHAVSHPTVSGRVGVDPRRRHAGRHPRAGGGCCAAQEAACCCWPAPQAWCPAVWPTGSGEELPATRNAMTRTLLGSPANQVHTAPAV